MPVGQAMPTEFNGMYNGWAVLNCNTNRVPDVYDENGQRLDPMQYAASIYGGQQVDVLLHCYEYDKAGNRGVATGLDAFAIIASANAPRQSFGGDGIDTTGAFGGGQPQQQNQNGGQPNNGPQYPQNSQNDVGYQNNQNGGYQNNQNDAQHYQQTQGGQNGGYQNNQNNQNNGGQQAHNFLPNQ